MRRFIDEALRMKEFDHPNVLSLIGVALDFDNLPLVVLPFMRHGDLLSYIRNDANVRQSYMAFWRLGSYVGRGVARSKNVGWTRMASARTANL